MRNPLGVPLLLTGIRLEYDFHPKAGRPIPSDASTASVEINVSPVELALEPSASGVLHFVLRFEQPGALLITGLSYFLHVTASSPETSGEKDKEALLHIPCRQKFAITGSRLNATKAEKMAVSHGSDHR